MNFKLWLESQERINWTIENPDRWEGNFIVGTSPFTVTVDFNPTHNSYEYQDDEFTSSWELGSQPHLSPRKIPKKSIIATIGFEDESGNRSVTGKVGGNPQWLRAMDETFHKLWQEREPDFITFHTKEATKIHLYDKFIWKFNEVAKHYIVLRMPKDFRDTSSLSPSEHFSTWLLQKKKATVGQEDWHQTHRGRFPGYEADYKPYLPAPLQAAEPPSNLSPILRAVQRYRAGKMFDADKKILNDLDDKTLRQLNIDRSKLEI